MPKELYCDMVSNESSPASLYLGVKLELYIGVLRTEESKNPFCSLPYMLPAVGDSALLGPESNSDLCIGVLGKESKNGFCIGVLGTESNTDLCTDVPGTESNSEFCIGVLGAE
jgi:hypothetical protein